MSDTRTDTREEPITKPPGRWRNKWLITRAHRAYCVVCGDVAFVRAGEAIFGHCMTYATIDDATGHARKLDAETGGDRDRDYLGAFPVEEA